MDVQELDGRDVVDRDGDIDSVVRAARALAAGDGCSRWVYATASGFTVSENLPVISNAAIRVSGLQADVTDYDLRTGKRNIVRTVQFHGVAG